MNKTENLIVIPDVHGRRFWEKAIKTDLPVVFLGDYVDPYPAEGITGEEAVGVLEDIISLKKSSPDQFTLLLGNHDLMYTNPYHREICCRHDYKNEGRIKDLLSGPEFSGVSAEFEVGGRRVILSHAGINPRWLEEHKEYGGWDEVVGNLGRSWGEESLLRSLAEVSYFRGGFDWVGSPVWCDVREFRESDEFGGAFQIFGHTQLLPGKIIEGENFAEIDCQRPFLVVSGPTLKQIEI